nr:MAG TPA: hypothetical protein [Bacteriophage sp.]
MSGIPPSIHICTDGRIQTRGRITNIYPCNIIHEISLGYCEPKWCARRIDCTILFQSS